MDLFEVCANSHGRSFGVINTAVTLGQEQTLQAYNAWKQSSSS